MDNDYLNHKTNKEKIINDLILPAVIRVRNKLLAENPDNLKLTGLCDRASKLFEYEFYQQLDEHWQYQCFKIKIKIVHGEQKHTPVLKSNKWFYEHTWVELSMLGYHFHIDPTSSQFQHFYKDIPNFYISTKKPKWYYPDKKNPCYSNKITQFINDNIKIPYECRRIRCIEYFQYVIWGTISDKIHSLVYNKR